MKKLTQEQMAERQRRRIERLRRAMRKDVEMLWKIVGKKKTK